MKKGPNKPYNLPEVLPKAWGDITNYLNKLIARRPTFCKAVITAIAVFFD